MKQGIYSFLGDFYHKHENIYPSVKKAAEQAGETLHDRKCISELSDVIDKNPAVIIIAAENRVNPEAEPENLWLTPELDEKLTDYVKNGGSFIAIHAALASYPEDSKYVDMVKGYFVSHPTEHYLVCYTSNEKFEKMPFCGNVGNIADCENAGNSEISKNSEISEKPAAFDYEVMDEHYVLNVNTAATNVFMTLSSEFGEGCGGWFHSYGNGKVIAVVPTHNKEGFEHPETVRLYKEAIIWAKSGRV